jgi:hypothetical protein
VRSGGWALLEVRCLRMAWGVEGGGWSVFFANLAGSGIREHVSLGWHHQLPKVRRPAH